MRDAPLLLGDCTLALYPADAAGDPILSAPVWLGARCEELRTARSFERLQRRPTGAIHPSQIAGAESNEIEMDRIWVIPLDRPRDFDLARGEFVLIIHGKDRRTELWHKRIYYGVRGFSYAHSSRGQVNFVTEQRFTAEFFEPFAGFLGAAFEDLPAEPPAALTLPLLFTHDAATVDGRHFLGAYQFAVAVTLTAARVAAQAGAAAVDVVLEVNGAATAKTLTIPGGSGDVSAADNWNQAVPAGQLIRVRAAGAGGASLAGVTVLARTEE